MAEECASTFGPGLTLPGVKPFWIVNLQPFDLKIPNLHLNDLILLQKYTKDQEAGSVSVALSK